MTSPQRPRKIPLEKLDGLELPAAADMHVHLRDGAMTELVVYDRQANKRHLTMLMTLPVQLFAKVASTQSS